MTWRDDAACRDADPAEFDSTTWADHLRARMLCADCPVTIQCRAEVEAQRTSRDHSPNGTWAGALWREGKPVPTEPPSGDDIDHGTDRGYNQHRYRGVPIPHHDPCGCRAAGTRRRAEQRKARR